MVKPKCQVVGRWANLNLPILRLIQYCTNTKDFMVPSLWGSVSCHCLLPATIGHIVLKVILGLTQLG